jgi:4-amino-4-deoxy-L-arabinose transferase-like glycosyltransferase
VSVIFQYVLLVVATFALARRLFSDRAAVFACALVACSPVIGWAAAMGQETGLTAIALTALLLYLPRDRGEETTGTLVAAGLAAGLGALAREYGLALIALGFGLILARRLSVRALVLFTGVAALAALPWYVRNWLHTGNPFFNLEVAGLFPVNRAHVWLMQSYQAEFGWSRQPPAAYTFLLANCWVALLGGFAGAWLFFRPVRSLLAAAALIVVLWAASLGYTAAGFTTALRVLSPALVVGAVLGGGACARLVPGQRWLTGAGLGLGLIALDAALRALTLPGPVYKIPPADWLTAGGAVHEYHARPVYARIAQFAGPQRLLVLGPNALLTLHGARTAPLWSPEVAFVFDRRLPPVEIARRLRAAGFGYILLNQGAANERYLAHSAYFLDPGSTLRAVASAEDMILLKILDAP